MRTPAGAGSRNPLLRDFRAAGGRAEGRAGGVAGGGGRGARTEALRGRWGAPRGAAVYRGGLCGSFRRSLTERVDPLGLPGGAARGSGTRLAPALPPRFRRHLTASALH